MLTRALAWCSRHAPGHVARTGATVAIGCADGARHIGDRQASADGLLNGRSATTRAPRLAFPGALRVRTAGRRESRVHAWKREGLGIRHRLSEGSCPGTAWRGSDWKLSANRGPRRFRSSSRLSCESLSTWARGCQNPGNGPTFLSRPTRSEPPPRECQRPGEGSPLREHDSHP